jgi:hypothetical protein
MEPTHELESVSDDELLRRLSDLLGQSRRDEAGLVAHIGEADSRRLYAREAAPSMFAYCTELLHLSEAEAYLRIAAARASREYPVLLAMLADGRLHLSAVAKLAPHLTRDNQEDLLKRATHRSKRQIEELLSELMPRPDAPAVMRKLPDRRVAPQPSPSLPLGPRGVGASESSESLLGCSAPAVLQLRPDAVGLFPPADPLSRVEPLAPARYKVQFTASAGLHDKLERLRALMRSSVPDGDLAAIIEQAVTEKLERLEARRFGRTKAPRKALSASESAHSTRHLPAAVRRAVHERDGGQCRYVDEQGRRCAARDGLEFHHRHPFGHGGDRSRENIGLLCKAHNLYLAEHDYGRKKIARHRRSGGRVSEPRAVYGYRLSASLGRT